MSFKVSIILPCYNAEKYIAQTIESVLKQTYEDFELIIIDDKSTDDSLKIIESFCGLDSRIRIIKLPQNYGMPSKPRNIAIRKAKYNWISFIDSDDIWHPEKLSIQISVLKLNTNIKFISSGIINFKNNIIWENPIKKTTSKIYFKLLLFKARTPTSSVIVNKELFNYQLFNESQSYKAREDMDLWLKFHENIKYSLKLNSKLVGYRVRQNQISGNKARMFIRHFNVLYNYKFKNKFKIGLFALILTISHFTIAVFDRLLKRGV